MASDARFRSVLWLAVVATAAQPAPAADPAVVAQLWVGSEQAVAAAAHQVGLPLPPTVTLRAFEQQLPILQPGDVRLDAPAALVVVASDDLDAQRMFTFVLPVKAGRAALDGLPNAAKTDATDTVEADGLPVRRTADHLVYGGVTPVTAKLPVDRMAADLRPVAGGPTPVLRLAVDLAAARRVAPRRFADAGRVWQAAREQAAVQRGLPAAVVAPPAWVRHLLAEQLDRASLAVDMTADGWTTVVELDPFPTAPTATVAKAGLPADVFARVDLQVPPAAVAGWLRSQVEPIGTPAEADAYAHLLAVCFAGDVETFGVGPDGADGAVLYSVARQRPDGPDLAADLRRVQAEAAKASPAAAGELTPQPYQAADGTTVYRFTARGAGPQAFGYLDVMARGTARYATVGKGDAHRVEGLPGLKPAGSFATVADGFAEPAKLLDLTSLDPLTTEQGDALKRSLGTARVTFTAKPTAGGAAFAATLPPVVLKAIGQAVRAMQGE